MDLLYHHAKYGEDRGFRAGCRRKSGILGAIKPTFLKLHVPTTVNFGMRMRNWDSTPTPNFVQIT